MNFQVMESHQLMYGPFNNSHNRERPALPITGSVAPINLACSSCQITDRT